MKDNREFTGKELLVIGTGISGIGSARLLLAAGAHPLILEQNTAMSEERIRARLTDEENRQIKVYTGELPADVRDRVHAVVPSPAVPLDTPFIRGFLAKETPVISEVELASRFMRGRLCAITGTNGKTTTTSLTGDIMRAQEADVHVVGNIGVSFAEDAVHTTDDTVSVAEISSFQLEAIDRFRPDAAAILNITPDHLDRHHTMTEYAAVKARIFENMGETDVCVLNYDDNWTQEIGKQVKGRVIWFSSKNEPEEGYYLSDDKIMLKSDSYNETLLSFSECNLVGDANAENVMAAIALAHSFGVPMDTIIPVVKAFRAVAHRIEFVSCVKGVDYYNDSKATNPDAAVTGIRAMKKPTFLIGGGYDKQAVYDDWIESFGTRVKELVLIGETRDKIADCAIAHGFIGIHFADSLEDALAYCAAHAKEGDAVLLSPACASWDMFPNYEVRGNAFKAAVENLTS